MNNQEVGNIKFAFLVHPRDINDVFRKYPLLKFIPKTIIEYVFLKFWAPVVLSKVTGVQYKKTNMAIVGYVISIPLTARQMMENRELARAKILEAAFLAKKKGVQIIGLGALTSSLTRGGLDLVDKIDINITTGHAYTAYNVTKNIFKLTEILGLDKKNILVAIVGAAGSVGSTTAKILAREGYNNLLLIDLEKRKHLFDDLSKDIKKLNQSAIIKITHQIKEIISADIILTATNAPEVLVKSEDLKMGAVVFDDAQPSDISPEVFDRDDVLVVEAGVVHTPGINSNFNFGLKDEFDNFCCMAELLILASRGWGGHYVINRATLESVDEIAKWGEELGFRLGHFQNPRGLVSNEKIRKIREIIQKRNVY